MTFRSCVLPLLMSSVGFASACEKPPEPWTLAIGPRRDAGAGEDEGDVIQDGGGGVTDGGMDTGTSTGDRFGPGMHFLNVVRNLTITGSRPENNEYGMAVASGACVFSDFETLPAAVATLPALVKFIDVGRDEHDQFLKIDIRDQAPVWLTSQGDLYYVVPFSGVVRRHPRPATNWRVGTDHTKLPEVTLGEEVAKVQPCANILLSRDEEFYAQCEQINGDVFHTPDGKKHKLMVGDTVLAVHNDQVALVYQERGVDNRSVRSLRIQDFKNDRVISVNGRGRRAVERRSTRAVLARSRMVFGSCPLRRDKSFETR